MKIILVDMSATLIHHGHIRLLKKANKLGSVTVALTTDEEILKYKGYIPELKFAERKEILEAIRYVDNVIASPWKLNMEFFKSTGADILIHGDDNQNDIPQRYIKIYERTKSISSSLIRERVMQVILAKESNNKKSI